MIKLDAAAGEDELRSLRERKRLVDDIWLLAVFGIFVAVGLPWYLRILDINFAPVAWSLFGYAFAYVISIFAAEGLSSPRSVLLVIGSMQAAGVVFFGFVWHLAGGLQNPIFLVIFVLPVVAGSLVLVSWQSYVTAILAVATVLGVALIDAPELRWYVTQGGSPPLWLTGVFSRIVTTPQPFPGLNPPPSYLFALLTSFTVLIFTVALMTESVSTFLFRLYGRLESSSSALSRAESLSSEVLQASPSPAALVHADTFKIAQASQSFMHELMLRPESLLNQNLFSLVEFTYPDVIEDLITGAGGEAPLAVYRVDGEMRVAKVRVVLMSLGGHRFAYVNIQDVSDLQNLQAALGAVDSALIVIGARRHVRYFNQAAQHMFSDLAAGIDAAIPLQQANLTEGWWELGSRTYQERRVEFNGDAYVASCVAVGILGETDAFTVLNIKNAGRAR